ncbi:MAG TPA: MoaD/ThiS family protein [Opitutales bacterium]|nr:MoaD/ThiS family protein [Opitutales bacterium]
MKILYFAHVAKALGRREDDLEVAEPLTTDALWERLLALRPALAQYRATLHLARNNDYARPGDTFANSDIVALLPPVSGG